MKPSLDGPVEKLARALEHLKSLNEEVSAFLRANPSPYTAVREINREQRAHIWRMKINAPVPRRPGVIVGDVVHNLRSSLDHLTWQLALSNKARPRRETAFPIQREADKHTKGLNEASRDAIRDLPDQAQKLIESIQPYTRTECGSDLLELNYLSRTDKHQIILRPFPQSTGSVTTSLMVNPESTMPRLISATPCDDGDELMRFTFREADLPNVPEDYQFFPTFDLAIDSRSRYGFSATIHLKRMHDRLCYEVFPMFYKFF